MTRLRFGAPLFAKCDTPEAWLKELKRKGYEAAYVPLRPGAPEALVVEFRQAAEENGIVIAENGAWLLNPLSEDPAFAKESVEKTAELLSFADRIGARCTVNVSGSRGGAWDSADPRNLTDETMDMIAESVREILRLAQPVKAKYALEMMPWMYPTGIADMQRLIKEVNDPRFGVHYDPCNTVNTVEKYFDNAAMTEEFIRTVGKEILSIHLKDILLLPGTTVRLEEQRPGEGHLDHRSVLKAVAEYCPDTPVMLEHMSREEDYDMGYAYYRQLADELGIAHAEPQN